jgi:hypothetical protein
MLTADAIAPYQSLDNILAGTGSPTEQAWHSVLCTQASDYWYWPGMNHSLDVWLCDLLLCHITCLTPTPVYRVTCRSGRRYLGLESGAWFGRGVCTDRPDHRRRRRHHRSDRLFPVPRSLESGRVRLEPESAQPKVRRPPPPSLRLFFSCLIVRFCFSRVLFLFGLLLCGSDFMIWTLVYDASGVSSVQLNYRVTPGLRAPQPANLLYAGGSWTTVQMIDVPLTGALAPETNPLPKYIADMVRLRFPPFACGVVC